MIRSVSGAIILCALGFVLPASQSQSPLRQQEVREGIGELRRSVHGAAAFLAKINRDEINDEAIFFDGQRRRLRGVIALARCVETVNDTLAASHEKAQTAASLRALIAELSEAAHGPTSLEQSHRGGSLLFASKSFEAFDKAQSRSAVSVSEATTP